MRFQHDTVAKPKSIVEIEGAEGVQVELVDDESPEGNHLPMTASVTWFIGHEEHFKDEGWEDRVAALRKLKDAGVPSVPLYVSRARKAGLKWRVVA